MRFRRLHPYKYQLLAEYRRELERRFESEPGGNTYVRLGTDGVLVIAPHYAWDGPSGPVPDTHRNLEASLVHDALYQLMREGYLDAALHRDWSDRLFAEMCRDRGVWRPVARLYYWGLRWFGGRFARPGT